MKAQPKVRCSGCFKQHPEHVPCRPKKHPAKPHKAHK